MNVLVVDDEKLIRDVIKEYLLLEKMNVTEAENGLEAIEKVKHDNFDIIIMDIMMPKMDGYTACREIKSIKDIPFIMLSARGEEYDLLKYFIDNKNIALSRENLLSNIWGYDFYGDDRTIDTHVKTLRKHLGKYKNMIVTVRAVGYKFEYEDEKKN